MRDCGGKHMSGTLEIHVDYAIECGTIDTPGLIYHEGYWHQFVDVEATETAMWRDCFAPAAESIVQHRHPYFQLPGETRVDFDATHLLGKQHVDEDRGIWRVRKRMLG